MPYTVKRYGTRDQYGRFTRCVKKVGIHSVRSPYAVCRASIYKKR